MFRIFLARTTKILSMLAQLMCSLVWEYFTDLFIRQIGEARALYNLGNVYHARGKHVGRSAQQDPGEFPPEVKDSLMKAAGYYE